MQVDIAGTSLELIEGSYDCLKVRNKLHQEVCHDDDPSTLPQYDVSVAKSLPNITDLIRDLAKKGVRLEVPPFEGEGFEREKAIYWHGRSRKRLQILLSDPRVGEVTRFCQKGDELL